MWIYGDDSSADTTLSWKAYEIRELTGLVIEAARLHHGIKALDA